MAADHAIDAPLRGGPGHDFLEPADKFDRILDLVLGRFRDRPIGHAERLARQRHPIVECQHQVIGGVADESEPAMRQHHRVELVAMQHHQAPPVGRVVERRAANFHAAEIEAGELAEHLIVISGDVDHARTATGAFHDPPDDIAMFGRPVEFFLQSPPVDDVADQVDRLAIGVVEEIDQQFGIAALGAQMDIRNPYRAELPPLIARGFGTRRSRTGQTGEIGDRDEYVGGIVRLSEAFEHFGLPVCGLPGP